MSANILSWPGDMRTITLMNDMLVRTNSPVFIRFLGFIFGFMDYPYERYSGSDHSS
jgi:hypothetical protein